MAPEQAPQRLTFLGQLSPESAMQRFSRVIFASQGFVDDASYDVSCAF